MIEKRLIDVTTSELSSIIRDIVSSEMKAIKESNCNDNALPNTINGTSKMAAYLGVSVPTVHNMMKDGRISPDSYRRITGKTTIFFLDKIWKN